MRLGRAFLAAVLGFPAPALAADLKPVADARLRYEHVDQNGIAEGASALTFRLRAGAELGTGDWSLLGEMEGVAPLIERYDSGLSGKSQFPIIADPENIELNRAQLQYRGLGKTVVTVGRQRINLDDQRFVGSVGWRQNEQTFDAVRLEFNPAGKLKLDLTYSWSVRTIWGSDGTGSRPQAIGGNNVFATVSHSTPAGTLSGFVFLADQDEAAAQNYRLSSQTYGLRLAGSRPIAKDAKLIYALSFARQSDFHRNPNNYSADFWLAELGAEVGPLKLGVGHERLGADDGAPLASFQTPLATLHKFQGWADKLLVTPPNGIRDWYGSADYAWKEALGTDSVNAALIYHRFKSDRLDLHYGNEWNAQLSAKKGRWTATAKLAAYNADQFSTNTTKFWFQLEWFH